ncbi:MAG: hypothetical protein ACHQUC_07525, partial [Chlamydiales bacterium]
LDQMEKKNSQLENKILGLEKENNQLNNKKEELRIKISKLENGMTFVAQRGYEIGFHKGEHDERRRHR